MSKKEKKYINKVENKICINVWITKTFSHTRDRKWYQCLVMQKNWFSNTLVFSSFLLCCVVLCVYFHRFEDEEEYVELSVGFVIIVVVLVFIFWYFCYYSQSSISLHIQQQHQHITLFRFTNDLFHLLTYWYWRETHRQ